MASGIPLSADAKEKFRELQFERTHRAVVYKINDGMTAIDVEKTYPKAKPGGAKAAFEEMAGDLMQSDCRLVVYDFEYVSQDITKNKLILILWTPDDAKVKSRMLYASSKQEVIANLEGIQSQVQATDAAELGYNTISDSILSTGVKY